MGYSKITLSALYSELASYSNPSAAFPLTERTGTPTEYYHQLVALGAGVPASLDLGPTSIGMSLPESVIVNNKGSNTMTVTWYRLLGPITNPGGNGFRFYNEGDADYDDGRIEDVDDNNKFAGVAVGDILVISNANLAANNATRTVGRVRLNDDEIYVTPSPATVTSDTTATMLRFGENIQTIDAGSYLCIPASTAGLSPGLPVTLESTAGTTCEIFMVGN